MENGRIQTTFLSRGPRIIACSYKTSNFQHIRSCCSEISLHRKRICLGRWTARGKFDLVFPTLTLTRTATPEMEQAVESSVDAAGIFLSLLGPR